MIGPATKYPRRNPKIAFMSKLNNSPCKIKKSTANRSRKIRNLQTTPHSDPAKDIFNTAIQSVIEDFLPKFLDSAAKDVEIRKWVQETDKIRVDRSAFSIQERAQNGCIDSVIELNRSGGISGWKKRMCAARKTRQAISSDVKVCAIDILRDFSAAISNATNAAVAKTDPDWQRAIKSFGVSEPWENPLVMEAKFIHDEINNAIQRVLHDVPFESALLGIRTVGEILSRTMSNVSFLSVPHMARSVAHISEASKFSKESK